ncbi:DNA polymerase II [Colwellia sp. 4_MG-2023]|jgi:DNA polymerase-2|uniref:DNA polymerase II n=1 Tax=unclassified Colwellia TaxID=196834 RepID=UPI001C083C6E|nr:MULTISPECIES: DNA polymerase II [unclassified Colwellia]MBU2924351.1 DNA polymerase II [Colwellia sp. C2M11]MDO6505424.1 DNA polymerase II [Colwellia sp. 5_MG-2023]MDO6554280.1 DNA polymerase II [Colwellia sp. 4_MG-2023]MDO6650847.1 DNA polymerase II [Colwellia sp. 3_MG-2023]MDO6663882.1 DNA polymerase II [Colwellia sp. 2_MG-2023]
MQTNLPQQIQQGFLLSRQVQDKGNDLQITLWLKTEKGAQKLVIYNELAVFFVEQPQAKQAEAILQHQGISLVKQQLLELKTFTQLYVHGFYFANLSQFYRARECLRAKKIKCYEDDIRPDDRYLMERFITADIDFLFSRNSMNYETHNTYLNPLKVKCKKSAQPLAIHLSMLSLDIECSMAGELYSIGLYANNNEELKRVLMIGDPQYDAESYIVWVANEKELLIELIKQVDIIDADIFIGWNVINFDFRLLQKRCDLHQVKFSIGRDGSEPRWRTNSNNTDQQFIEIAGRVVLDGIDLLKTATYSFPSFSLDNVANTLLGIGKKVDNVENRVDEITDNFLNNKPALAAYNLEDCRLVWLIFEKTQLLEFAQLRAQLTGLAIDRIGGSVAAFTNLYLPKLHRSGYVAPNMGDGVSGLISPGGYVMDSIPGLYSNVLVLDFKSLYPSIIRSFKIDPMGLVEGLLVVEKEEANTTLPVQNKKVVEGFDGAYFSRDKHFLPDIITSLWLERDKAKLQKNAALSQAIKIIMNSFYGVLGSTGCRFFDPRLSGSITKRSHEILKKTTHWIEEHGFRVIYGDTDSIFVHVGDDRAAAECKSLGRDLQGFINAKWQHYIKAVFDLPCDLEIEFETHFTKFLMPTIRGQEAIKGQKVGTKKRYVGLSDGKLIFKGLETVRSDWTQASKVFQQELFRRVFDDLPIDEYICTLLSEIRAGKHDNNLVYMKKIRRDLNDYVNTPPHIKACLIANKASIDSGQSPKYRKRSIIEYVMTLNGVMPIELSKGNLDYEHYIDKQIKPIADDVLPFLGKSFDEIVSKQINLF